jgi:hypothetical protein
VFEGDLFHLPIRGRGILIAKADSRKSPVAATTRLPRTQLIDAERKSWNITGTLLLEGSRLFIVAANACKEMDGPDVD